MCLVFTTSINAAVSPNDDEENNDIQILNSIEFIELEDTIELGFDVAYYLPYGFDPYRGMIFDISEIEFMEETKTINLDFDTSFYLPQNFNPYKGQ